MHLTTLNSIHLIRWKKFLLKHLLKATAEPSRLDGDVTASCVWKLGFVSPQDMPPAAYPHGPTCRSKVASLCNFCPAAIKRICWTRTPLATFDTCVWRWRRDG